MVTYFLSHNNGVHILFDLKKNKKKLLEGKKIYMKYTAVLWNTNYDRENNDYMNALRPSRFKWCDFSTNFL